MARVLLQGRVSETQAATLRAYADEVGLPLYQATVRALELGIAALVTRTATDGAEVATPVAKSGTIDADSASIEAIEIALGEIMARSERSDVLLRQTLFAAGAAYAAALAAAGEGASLDRKEAILGEVALDAQAVFERQLAKTREGKRPDESRMPMRPVCD